MVGTRAESIISFDVERARRHGIGKAAEHDEARPDVGPEPLRAGLVAHAVGVHAGAETEEIGRGQRSMQLCLYFGRKHKTGDSSVVRGARKNTDFDSANLFDKSSSVVVKSLWKQKKRENKIGWLELEQVSDSS